MDKLPPHLQKAINANITGLEIIHGELKNRMLRAEELWEAAKNNEPLADNEYDESDSYHMGYGDALQEVYQLTYLLAFAIGDTNE